MRARPIPRSTPGRGTTLVVDDEGIMREILETLLTREGYAVRVAASGSEGLELARAPAIIDRSGPTRVDLEEHVDTLLPGGLHPQSPAP